MDTKQRFLEIYNSKITREGADKMLEYLENSDFFTAPASTRFHGSYPGGLAEHCVNVYECLKDYLSRPRTKEVYGMDFTDESVAIVALLHDVCKIGCYKTSTRNVKENGQWKEVPYFEFSDPMPYGHGEKSVYIINGYMRLKRDEAFAIRYHMGFSGTEDKNTIGTVMEKFPLALALSIADMESTYFLS
ncbi:MAG: hydrolase [Clostridia bacterium]|nr:hydrolase [Clostridia bacterium]